MQAPSTHEEKLLKKVGDSQMQEVFVRAQPDVPMALMAQVVCCLSVSVGGVFSRCA